MSRIRADYVFGTTDTALTSGDTTLSSSALANLPAVASPDVAAITLHDGTDYEIVHVTAHTAAATTATILRGQEGSTAAAWASGVAWVHGFTVADTDQFVSQASLVPLPEADVGYKKDALSAPSSGALVVTLGTTPLSDSELVAINGAITTDYTLTGNTLTLNTVTSGDAVVIQYAYPGSEAAPDDAAYLPTITDTFTRANSTTTLGDTESGQTWQALQGIWGISSNQAYLVTAQSTDGGGNFMGNDTAAVDVGTSDVTLTVKIPVWGNGGPAMRVQGYDNCITTNVGALYVRVNGENLRQNRSDGGSDSFSQTFVDGDTIRATLSGNTITIYRDAGSTGSFAQVGVYSVATFNTETKFGIRSRTNNTARFDDFEVVPG